MIIPDRPDRIPDSIEPLVGYRAWYFTNGRSGPSLQAINSRDPVAWEGANRRWVSATCPFDTRVPEQQSLPPTMRERMEEICAGLGFPPEFILRHLSHTIPGEDCSCGFYAMKELGSLLGLTGDDVVIGRVALAGKVIECTSGYRAERARIAALIPMNLKDRSVRRLADSLGLPLDAAILRWPRTDGLPPAA